VVDPELIISEYGADTARLFMMSDSPPERDMEWTESGAEGAARFLKRLFRLSCDDSLPPAGTAVPKDGKALDLVRAAHKAIAAITDDIERFRFNRAVAQLYTLANAINDMPLDAPGAGAARRFAIETLTVLLGPIAPHVAEEMWFKLGHDNMLAKSAWPVADPAMLAEDTIEIGVQVNGKLRDTVSLARDVDENVARAAALETAGVIRYLEGASPKKIIVVRNRIINVVI
jgi:leucyl-tRNA synthetase